MDIIAGLAAAGQALSIARSLRDVDKAYDQAVLKGEMFKLMEQLQDVRAALQDARDESVNQQEEITRLKKAFELRAKTITVNGFRYTADPAIENKPVGPPFCRRCEEVDGRMILCIGRGMPNGAVCPQCNTAYGRGSTVYLWPEQRSTTENH